ncbi:hypothetical protein OROMI_033650 [Orobanche minor]
MSDEVNPGKSPFSVLPEECIANIISLTSPKDACRVAAVSLGFKSASDSDVAWERFLPPNHNDIVSRASSPPTFSTKKQLYFLLRDSTLYLDGGHMIFEFSGRTGKTSYTLGARKLQIGSIDDPKHWKWISLRESRFSQVAKLKRINRLDIGLKMETRLLSPKTTYVAWLVYRFTVMDSGLDVLSKASIKLVKEDGTETQGSTTNIYLLEPHDRIMSSADGKLSWAVEGNWYEIELGEFSIGEGRESSSDQIHIQVSETERLNHKRGLIVEGIALRPKYRSNFPDVASFMKFCWQRTQGIPLDDEDLMG